MHFISIFRYDIIIITFIIIIIAFINTDIIIHWFCYYARLFVCFYSGLKKKNKTTLRQLKEVEEKTGQ